MNKCLVAVLVSLSITSTLANASSVIDVTFDSGDKIYSDSVVIVENNQVGFSEETTKTFVSEYVDLAMSDVIGDAGKVAKVVEQARVGVRKTVKSGYVFLVSPNPERADSYNVVSEYRGKPEIKRQKIDNLEFVTVESQVVVSSSFNVVLREGQTACTQSYYVNDEGASVMQELCMARELPVPEEPLVELSEDDVTQWGLGLINLLVDSVAGGLV